MITGDKLDIFLNFKNARPKKSGFFSPLVVLQAAQPAPSNSILLGFDSQGRIRVARKFWLDPILRLFGLAPRSVKPTMSILQFFTQVKNSSEELEVLAHEANNYEIFMNNAKQLGQTALFEQLEERLTVRRSEAMMLANGFTKAVSEDVIVRFGKQSPRGLRLDWIDNFTRVLPADVAQRLRDARDLDVFDNFVVLHYDPEGKATKLTKKELEAKKDPILFGVIEGSNRLYYITDWIDEHCDLTLDQLAKHMGKKVVERV